MMYLFYIDESESKDVSKNISTPKAVKDIFALVAVGVFDYKWRGFNHAMRECKRGLYEKNSKQSADSLKIKDYEVKSQWLRRSQKRAHSPFLRALSAESLESLAMKYYEELFFRKMTLFGVVVDKTALPSNYDHRQMHGDAMEMLYEQIETWIWSRQRRSRKRPYHKAIVIADDCGQQTNYHIAVQHADILRTQTRTGIQFRNIVETPLFTRSELSEGIQLADLCAYNINRAFAHDDMNYSYFKKILPRFHRFKGANTADIETIIRMFPGNNRFPSLGPPRKRLSRSN